jgi:hypothetical protein
LCGQVTRHAFNIFHECNRVPEDVVIDSLQNEMHRRTRRLKREAPGVVDMAASVWRSLSEFAAELKLPNHGVEIVI